MIFLSCTGVNVLIDYCVENSPSKEIVPCSFCPAPTHLFYFVFLFVLRSLDCCFRYNRHYYCALTWLQVYPLHLRRYLFNYLTIIPSRKFSKLSSNSDIKFWSDAKFCSDAKRNFFEGRIIEVPLGNDIIILKCIGLDNMVEEARMMNQGVF